ncbi:MAG: hypothetical protein JWP43_1521 [Ramlibacter sp.]|jgi:hypothetical protein|nr:hypothetical protein [Ramlibacter sp.]
MVDGGPDALRLCKSHGKRGHPEVLECNTRAN